MRLVDDLRSAALMLALSLCCVSIAPGAPKEDPLEEKYRALVNRGDASTVARAIHTATIGPSASAEIDGLGKVLATEPDMAVGVLDALAQPRSVTADTLRAELLIWMARGDETPQWKRKQRKVQPETLPTAVIGRRAGELLLAPDPFVRGARGVGDRHPSGCRVRGAQGLAMAVPGDQRMVPPLAGIGWRRTPRVRLRPASRRPGLAPGRRKPRGVRRDSRAACRADGGLGT